MTETAEKRYLSIVQWHALCQSGTVLPMCIPLDGDSMRPLIRRKSDIVSIVPLSRPLLRGDVVLFEHPTGRYVVHRIYRMRDDSVQTLGDHCWNPDPWMPQSCVLGLVTQFERDGRTLALDSDYARRIGRIWMKVLPLRRFWWKMRARAGRILKRPGGRR